MACVRLGCCKASWNGSPNEYCTKTCRREAAAGTPITMQGGLFCKMHPRCTNAPSGTSEFCSLDCKEECEQAIDVSEPLSRYCHVVNMPGKGFGTLASAPIARGDLILEERPLLRVPRPSPEEEEKQMADVCLFEDYMRGHAAGLSGVDAQYFWSLACYDAANKTAAGIINVNNFSVAGENLVFHHISRLNHTCKPNCGFSFDADHGVGKIFALRDIAEGEELCVTYTELTATKLQRQEHLCDRYNFVCACPVCSQGIDDSLCSDHRRQALKSCCEALYEDIFVNALLEGAGSTAQWLGLRLACQIIRLLIAEGLVGQNDGISEACETAVTLLAGHAEARDAWADEYLNWLGPIMTGPAFLQVSKSVEKLKSSPTPFSLPPLSSERLVEVGNPELVRTRAIDMVNVAGDADRLLEELQLLTEVVPHNGHGGSQAKTGLASKKAKQKARKAAKNQR